MFTLAGADASQYDFNHMLPNPYDLIPSSALCPFSGAIGDVVFHQGDPTHGLYVVQTGRVHLERVGPNGERFIIHRAQAGTSFAGAKTAQNNSDDNGHGDFYYSPPSGFLAICTKNVAETG